MLWAILIICGVALILGIIAFILLYQKLSAPDERLEAVARFSAELEAFERNLRDDIQRLRADLLAMETDTRRELVSSLNLQNENLDSQNRKNREESAVSLSQFSQQINTDAAKNRTELGTSLNNLSETLARKLQDLVNTQQQQFEALKTALEGRMEQIRANNETKLEEMRKTVDEKLHDTLEKRLGESFKLVSERLELVHKGLGEMQSLASGVGDLKKVLTNVKNRGMMGEIQLGAILEQMLTPEQYERNFKPFKRRDEVVEFAIRLPGRDEDQDCVYLPIDAKFPIEDYHRLVEAWDAGDPAAVESARKGLRARIQGCARDIRDKYINPPLTTDFALLFLPVEGLYAEVLRDPALFDQLRRQYQVVVVGPTTVSAILSSLQMGFRTLAIEKRTGEVWKILSAVKNEFGKFGLVLEKTQKKLQEASNTIETASHRSRQIQRKLNKVQSLPVDETSGILELEDDEDFAAAVVEPDEEDLA
ncbi:MAG: DNA recombination protein RmuC [Candidatus Cloacimonetes bacterium]|nr:DNA recombination protein RmuC [Candidatus Cloacimonadota bacterium]